VQLCHSACLVGLRIRALFVEKSQLLDGRSLPLRDLVQVELMLAASFRNRPFAADHLKRSLGFGLGRKGRRV
jgi:hypothetical protein